MTVKQDADKLREQLAQLETQRVDLEKRANQAEAQEMVRQVAASIEALGLQLVAAERNAALEREAARAALQKDLDVAQAEADRAASEWTAARARVAAAEQELKDAEGALRGARHTRGAKQARASEIGAQLAKI